MEREQQVKYGVDMRQYMVVSDIKSPQTKAGRRLPVSFPATEGMGV